MASITVYFKPIVESGVALPYYHEFIVYQPDSGDAQYLRGGPAAKRLSRNDIGMTWSGWAAGANRDSSGLRHTRRDRDVDPDHPTTA